MYSVRIVVADRGRSDPSRPSKTASASFARCKSKSPPGQMILELKIGLPCCVETNYVVRANGEPFSTTTRDIALS